MFRWRDRLSRRDPLGTGDRRAVCAVPPSEARSVLMLQGPAGPCFARLGQALSALGHQVHKVNFNLGDRVFWRGPRATAYRGGLAGWPRRCEALMREHGVTDLVLFGDCRPLHRAAIAVAGRLGVRVLVADEGYLRPDWITFEPHGVNGHSLLPRDPDWYRLQAALLPAAAESPPAGYRFGRRALEDVVYNFASIAGRLAYPGYATHRPWHPLVEYAGWLWRLSRLGQERRRSARSLGRLAWQGRQGRPSFLFPLQLDCDYQLRTHSPFGSLLPAIARVLASFARCAPADCLLVVKQHPLENGLRDWRGVVSRTARACGVADRVVFLEQGTLSTMVADVRGMVTVNSTSAMAALAQGVPVHALGNAVYDLPGLTSGGTLDDFWTAPMAPDASLFAAFRRVLIDRCLVPGSFYSARGLDLMVAGALARMNHAPLPRATVMREAAVLAPGAAVGGCVLVAA